MLVLTTILPPHVRDEVKPILRMQESDFTEDQMPYKILKDEVIKIFKAPQEATFERAMGRVLVGLPSQLARQLVNDLCNHKLVGCCCPTFIVGLWKRQLPDSVKQGVAGMEFNAANFDAIITKADKVFQSTRPNAAIPSVSALGVDPLSGAVSLPGPSVLNEGFHQSFPQQQQLAAVTYGRGRGRGGNGRGQRGGRGRDEGPD